MTDNITMIMGDETVALKVVGRRPTQDVLSRLTSVSADEWALPNVFYLKDGNSVHLAFIKNPNPTPTNIGKFFYIWQPKIIPMVCTVSVTKDGFTVPNLREENPQNNVIHTLNWKPTIPHLFMLCPTMSNGQWVALEMFLVAVHKDQIWRAVLPNTNTDGKLCHGVRGNVPPVPCKTAQDLLEFMANSIRDSIWNADWSGDWVQQCIKFKGTSEGLEQVNEQKLIDDPGSILTVCSNETITRIVQLCKSFIKA